MAKQTINIGASPNDGTGTPLRTSFDYCNQNFTELYTATGPSGNNIVVPGNATITGDLTVDTNTLKVDSANNRVGIGTASPDNELSVRAASIATIDVRGGVGGAGGIKISGNGTTLGTTSFDLIQNSLGAIVYQRDALPLFFNVNGSERYAISSAGVATWSNVGGVAGTAMTLNSTGLGVGGSPVSGVLLTVGSTSSVSATANALQTLSNKALFVITSDGATNGAGTTINYSWANGGQGPLIFRNAAIANVMTLDASGNVGVGVTPSAWAAGFKVIQASTGVAISTNAVVDRCDISANYYFNAGNKFLNATGRASNFSQDGGAFYFYQSTGTSGGVGSAITWGPGMTLDSSGNLVIGKTPALARLDVASTRAASVVGGIIGTTGTGSVNDEVQFLIKNVNTASGQNNGAGVGALLEASASNKSSLLFYVDNGTTVTNVGRFDSNGNLILQSSATPATLATNGQLTMNATSNTNLRFSYRGSDGITRVANLTLA